VENVEVLIGNETFRLWSEVEIEQSIDAFSQVTLRAPYEPDRREFRDTFRPFSFKPMTVAVNGGILFTGTFVGPKQHVDATSQTVEVVGYALPAVLNDCSQPGVTKPREFKKLGLRAIIETLLKPYGLTVEFAANEGAKFEKAVKIEVDQKILDFIAELAKQRNLVITDTWDGALLCWQSVKPGNPVLRLQDGRQPISEVEADFNPQEYFSEITGFGKSKRGKKGGRFTEKNPWLDVLRPHAFKLDDTEPADTPTATRAKLGRMFAGAVSYSLNNLPTWRTPDGELFRANTTMVLEAPTAAIYRPTELLIRRVRLKQTATEESTSLDLCLPGAFSGEVPEVLPWDEP
jgi:prophage tail gpP-like protein